MPLPRPVGPDGLGMFSLVRSVTWRWGCDEGMKASVTRFMLGASKEVNKTHLPQFSEVPVGGLVNLGDEKVMVHRWNKLFFIHPQVVVGLTITRSKRIG